MKYQDKTFREVFELLDAASLFAGQGVVNSECPPVFGNDTLGQAGALYQILGPDVIAALRRGDVVVVMDVDLGTILVRRKKEPQGESTIAFATDEGLLEIISILGANRVLTPEQSRNAQGKLIMMPELLGNVDMDVIRECAEMNNKPNEFNWRFVFVQGFSLRQQRQTFGINRDSQPCFWKDSKWWLKSEQDFWATQGIPAGYHLIDFNGGYPRTNWDNQEQLIVDLGGAYGRAFEEAVTESALGFYKTNNGERLLLNWNHWGKRSTANGGRVYVGYFNTDGWYVSDAQPDYAGNDDLRVCLSRQFIKISKA